MSRGLGKIERMVLEKAVTMAEKSPTGISKGRISIELRKEILGLDVKAYAGRCDSLQRAMWIIGAIKSGTRVFTDGRELTDEELQIYKCNKTLRDSISRATRRLVEKGYFIPVESEHEWEDLIMLNPDKCKRVAEIPPKTYT